MVLTFPIINPIDGYKRIIQVSDPHQLPIDKLAMQAVSKQQIENLFYSMKGIRNHK